MTYTRRTVVWIAAAILLTCTAVGQVTTDQWAQDLDFLHTELPKRHKNLFHKISQSEFQAQIGELKSGLPTMTQEEILAGIMKILASVGDSHTTLGYRPQQALPLMLYWFKDGIVILNTTPEYRDSLYGKITAMEGKPIEEVIAALASVIPHENRAQVKQNIPNLLTDTVVLYGLKLISSRESASLTVQASSGRTITLDVKPISFSSKPEWIVDTRDKSDAPLYRKNSQLYYWYKLLPDHKTLFFKYNSCQNRENQPFIDFVRALFNTVDTKGVKKIVIDLRHNGGGNSGIFAPFLVELKKRPHFLQKGSIYVLIGRRTFSSAILNAIDLKKQTSAIFLGEPTGGKPNHYGEVQMFRLPQSGLPVTYSIKYFRVLDDDPESLQPDFNVEPRISDYLRKTDPVLNYVLEKRNPV
jgi:hypothetical protein